MKREEVIQFFIDKEYANNTNKKEDKDIKDSSNFHPYEEVKENGKSKKTFKSLSPKVVAGAGAVTGAGAGMALSTKNLKELKSLKAKQDKSPADLIRIKKLRRTIAMKIGAGTIAGGALGYGAVKNGLK